MRHRTALRIVRSHHSRATRPAPGHEGVRRLPSSAIACPADEQRRLLCLQPHRLVVAALHSYTVAAQNVLATRSYAMKSGLCRNAIRRCSCCKLAARVDAHPILTTLCRTGSQSCCHSEC